MHATDTAPHGSIPHKAIPPARDRLQSRLLTAVMLPVLGWCAVFRAVAFQTHRLLIDAGLLEQLLGVSLTFALLVWLLRAATPLAAFSGGLINFVVLLNTTRADHPHDVSPYLLHRIAASGFTPILVLFLLTFAATKAGRRRKQRAGLAESRKGRNAAQVIANLGAAALVSLPGALAHLGKAPGCHAGPFGITASTVMLLAVLAEATADTVSSEIGQAFGGTPRMITNLRQVAPGTDGAVSVGGTFAGLLASALLVAAGAAALSTPLLLAAAAWLAGAAGLLLDSLLGATVERKGWLGNDLVNFSATLFAGGLGLLAWQIVLTVQQARLLPFVVLGRSLC